MQYSCFIAGLISLLSFSSTSHAQEPVTASNPILFADVPDMSMIRVGNVYYMSSTTMHMSPGVPIMKSTDLVNWRIVNYAYDTLAAVDALQLQNGKNAYGAGSWASSLRYHQGLYYVTTFASTTGKTYIYTTPDIEKGPWRRIHFEPSLHDHTIFFEEDGKTYMIYGNGKLSIIELKPDLSGIQPNGIHQVVIENASLPAGTNIGLGAEGSQLYKINGYYYLFAITWPRGGMRTVVIHRAKKITGPYEGRLALQDKGVAQGGLIDMPNGNWYAYLFQDYGAVGRIPYLVPVKWENDWPVLGEKGKVPMTLNLPPNQSLSPGIVASDDFSRKPNEPDLPLVWQWNHNPDNSLWSVKARKGFLRLRTGRIDTSLLRARNTLTQRTVGPASEASIELDCAHMKNGDIAGLALLQKNYGWIGIKKINEGWHLQIVNTSGGTPELVADIPVPQSTIHLRASCDFTNKTDTAFFSYSFDGHSWTRLGTTLKMRYTLPHFMGYRFAIFNFATRETGGFVDFNHFNLSPDRWHRSGGTGRVNELP
jgi:beta-xylosidase